MNAAAKKNLPAKVEYLQQVVDFVSDIARQQGINSDKITNMQVVVEEIFVNICRYSYEDNNLGIQMRCWADDNNFFNIEMIDWGQPFNILNSENPDITMDIESRKIGGLGIWIVKNLTDKIKYSRIDDKNVLEVSFKIG